MECNLHICFIDSDGVQRKILWRIVRLYQWYSTQTFLGWYRQYREEVSVQKSIGDERLTAFTLSQVSCKGALIMPRVFFFFACRVLGDGKGA